MGPEVILILIGWAIAGGSPGPATLAISGAAMSQGRSAGLSIASGVLVGSACWGIASALGMSALMMANAWIFDVVRYAGAAYLLYLAIKSLRNAMNPKPLPKSDVPRSKLFVKGLLLHLTNPKAVFSWGAIYAIALHSDASIAQVWTLFGLLFAVSMMLFWGYGLLFSAAPIARIYVRMRRWFDAAFGLLFGAASLKLLTTRLT